MNRTLKCSLSIASSCLLVSLVAAHISLEQSADFCANIERGQYEVSLPMSHPLNRCAAGQSKNVSWTNWFSGRSPSYQFHYLDLLELLSRSTEEKAN
ncbi:hypothetical protein [Aliiglaciecola sp. LCG003]|uniref:hypothetical protein n=1 Tax=Aliiglaciecola sp. LCG003 TaxID=3053655 RepID=UPI00257414D1|nr:hypothetical protein [Aliiglaciecola sp. LCG003]WJG10006.1 hypothetical protein QR722_02915 [Aliiglaciecola sp. LCG003]